MGTPPQQHIDVHVSCSDQQTIGIPRWNDGMAMREANAQGAMSDDLGEGKVGGLGVEIALDDLEVRGHGAEVVVGLLVSQVAETEDLGDFVGGEELLELGAIC